MVENESTLKRFFLDTEIRCVHLHPENPKYPEIYTQKCSIQGVAVHVIKSLQ
nr:S24 family peptidase [Anaerobutyricum soehngenii]